MGLLCEYSFILPFHSFCRHRKYSMLIRYSSTVTVAPPAEAGEAKAYAAWGASTEALRLYDNNEREVQPVDTLAQPQYREVEVVSRAAPLTAFLAAPGRVSAENPWESMEYRRESF
jgi:hypothetical protein